MSEPNSKLQADRALLEKAHAEGPGATLRAYLKLSGPGWLQSAITLGGGSLGSSLYLGVLAGVSLLWLQPVAMVLGVIMLSAIGYVTLSTGERPFQAINRHVNPLLGWSWALASLLANMVWVMPQYSLATGVLQQNLMPGLLGGESALGEQGGKLVIVAVILVLSVLITWSYDSGGWGIRVYEALLKVMVGLIVVCFASVVVVLTFSEQGLAWGKILGGLIPNPMSLFRPSPDFQSLLGEITNAGHRAYWSGEIVRNQRDVMFSAAATAVGINMTFLFPYSLLRRGWTKEFRGLAMFDLSTGMFVPYVLATSCVIIAAMAQFHAVPQENLLADPSTLSAEEQPGAKLVGAYEGILEKRVAWELRNEDDAAFKALDEDARQQRVEERLASMPPSMAEKRVATCLVTRDAFDLARALEPLTGSFFANFIFGLGVLGMTLSTITLLMLISGFVICEMLGLPPKGWPHRLGTLAAVTGAFGPFFWTKASFWLVVPTSIFGLTLLPVAYIAFFLLMNQKRFLGDAMPQGGARLRANVLMGFATLVASVASVWAAWGRAGWYGVGAIALFVALLAVVQLRRRQ